MDHPAEFVGLQLYPYQVKLLFRLWQAHGRTVPHEALHKNRAVLHRYISGLRQALKDAGLPWVLDVEHGVGVRLLELNGLNQR